jgi:hypothetical protein
MKMQPTYTLLHITRSELVYEIESLPVCPHGSLLRLLKGFRLHFFVKSTLKLVEPS